MIFTLERFKSLLTADRANQGLTSISTKVIGNQQWPRIIGKFGQNLLQAYQETSDQSLSAEASYLNVKHNDENGTPVVTKVHRKNRIKYASFPAIFNEEIPDYNAQIIYAGNDS